MRESLLFVTSKSDSGKTFRLLFIRATSTCIVLLSPPRHCLILDMGRNCSLAPLWGAFRCIVGSFGEYFVGSIELSK